MDDYVLIDPSEVPGKYETGEMVGVRCDAREIYLLLSELEKPLFSQQAPHLYGSGRGKLSRPFLAAIQLDKEAFEWEPQQVSDCTSHSNRNAGFIDYACDVVSGLTEYRGRLCTEVQYANRGTRSDSGSSCSQPAKYVNKYGYLVRGKYPSPDGKDVVDLSKYNPSYAVKTGGTGTPDWLDNIAKENPAETIAYITTTDEACDAISNGYGISVCSGYGFSSVRDSWGLSSTKGGWSHAMVFIACNDDPSTEMFKKYGRCFLVGNSWAIWNNGPKSYDQPNGSFWITERNAQGMINAGGSWVISNVKGFKRRNLDYLLI